MSNNTQIAILDDGVRKKIRCEDKDVWEADGRGVLD